MTSSVIDFGVGRILSVLENEVLHQIGLNDEIEMMKQKLLFMKSFLEQHGNSSIDNDGVFETFVKGTRDLAYKIENIIDEFSYHISRRRGQARLTRVIHYPLYVVKRRSIVEELEEMNRKIRELSDLMNIYHHETSQGALPIVVDGGDTKWVKNLQESSFFAREDSLVGIEEAKKTITEWLLQSESQRTVITVVGMGGSGKTALVGNIFKSQHVRKHFDSCLWVTISQSYDIEDVFRTMIRNFHKERDLPVPINLSSMIYRELVEMLVEYLQQKKYIIVLDDVWKTDFWKKISVALPDGSHGSRVMITTRDKRVADFCYGTTIRSQRVEPLNEDKAWELFCKKAFSGNPVQSIEPNIEPIARNLVTKCKGLPLAIVALGSMMSTRKLESEWRYVHDSLNQELNNDPNLKDVQRILVLSFNDLPLVLRHCFLYCCIFPEDHRIKRKKLVRMWMAQGFVEQKRGVKPEEVADNYLMELVYRNMLEVVSRNNDGRPKEFQVHDIMREVSLVISKDQKFCNVYDDEEIETRHLCTQREISSSMMLQSLHTLLVCSSSDQKITLPTGLKFLKALDFENLELNKLPDSLTTLFNLRYFNVGGTQVRKLPKSFHRLLNLETLITKDSRIQELPAKISKFQNLQYLSTSNMDDTDWSSFPSGMEVSPDICQLKRLKVMEVIRANGELIKNLGNMTQLTKLYLTNVRKDHGYDLCNSISKLKDLRSLSLRSISEGEALPIDTLSPPTSIKNLSLSGKLERLPSWIKTLHNLTHLELMASSLREDPIPCIQELSKLVQLRLVNAYEGDKLCFAKGSQSMKELWIIVMPLLTNIVIQGGAMPNLQEMHIVVCTGMKRVPNGIESLTNLQKLYLFYVTDELLESIRGEQGVDRSKVNHIPTITHVYENDSGVLSAENLS